MKQCLIIIEIVCGLVLVLALSRLTFVKKSIYYGWIDKREKITLFDYIGQYDDAWIFESIDYNRLLSANPDDSLLREYINEIKILKIASIIPAGITGIVVIIGTIANLWE